MNKIRLGDVAKERKETFSGKKSGVPIVGLEHLVPEQIRLDKWDFGGDSTFTKVFKSGDVLFGRRRAYLKKAAYATFDGVCSGDITVIEALPSKMLPELLPHIIQNDDFFDYAVGKSAGSLSPRVKWQYLKNYEFALPDLESQRSLAKLLWSMQETIEAYEELLEKTDELVKSRFVEMFGEPMDPKKVNSKFTDCVLFNPKKSEVKNSKGLECSFVPMECVGVDGSFSIKRDGTIGEFYKGYTYFRDNDVLLAKITPCFENGKSAIAVGCTNGIGFGTTEFHVCRCIEGRSHPQWLKHLLKNNSLHDFATTKMTGSAGQKRIQTPFFEHLDIYVPPYDEQLAFASFTEQVDKSKFNLQSALTELKAVKKKLLSDALNTKEMR